MTILDQLADHVRHRVAEAKRQVPPEALKRQALAAEKGHFVFENAIKKEKMAFICECKKASPSKGLIAPDFPYTEIAREYEAAGADCISCLTEPRYFLGSDEIFHEVRRVSSLPMIRKDFTVSLYQLDQARVMGADAALLIVSLMDREMLKACLRRCEELGIAALTETHDEAEIRTAVDAGARIIGINNRNLKDFSVDFSNTARLRDLIPADRICVAESGVRGPEDVARLRAVGADAVLIGETLMRTADKAACLKALKEEA